MRPSSRARHGERAGRRIRSAARLLGVEAAISNADLVDEVHGWVLSLPWVTEWPPSAHDPDVRRFAIACDPLGWQGAWVLTGKFDGLDGIFEIHLVLPERMAQRGLEAGWALPLVRLDAHLSVVSVLMPTTASELRALEDLLSVAYASMFQTFAAQSRD